jgi:hypothetical protein
MKLYTEEIKILSLTIQFLFALLHLFLNSPRTFYEFSSQKRLSLRIAK